MKRNSKTKKLLASILALTLILSTMGGISVFANGIIINPTAVNDTFDNETSTFNWQPSWSGAPEYVDEEGRGKVLGIKFATKAAATETNINFAGVDTQLAKILGKKYLSFDIKESALRNMSFSLVTSAWTYPLSFYTAEKGWICATSVTPQQSPSGTLQTLLGNTKATITSWGWSGFENFAANEWHNIRFVLDPDAGTVSGYIDNKLEATVNCTASTQSTLNRILIRNMSAETDGSKKILYVDNFQIGSVNNIVEVSKAEISEAGKLSVTFDNPIDASTATTSNIKLTNSNGDVTLSNGSYDETTKTYTADVVNYAYYLDYTISVKNITGKYTGDTFTEYNGTVKGKPYKKNTVVKTENFDDQVDDMGMTVPWLEANKGFELKSGTDYYWRIKFIYDANGLVGYTGKLFEGITSDVYYVKFDFKTATLDNYSFSLAKSQSAATTAPLSLGMSRNGYMIGTNLTTNNAGLAGNSSVLNNSRATIDAAKNDWASCSTPMNYAKETWYNAMYVLDTIDNKISLYINDELVRTKENINPTDYNYLAYFTNGSTLSEAPKTFSFDNFEIGTMLKPISVVSSSIESDGTVKIVTNGAIDVSKFTTDKVRFSTDNGTVPYTNVAFDQTTKTLSFKITDYNEFLTYHLSIVGVESFAEYSNDFKGITYKYYPQLSENFDGDEYLVDFKPQWCGIEYVDYEGRGKVAGAKYAQKGATTPTNIQISGLSNYMKGDIGYISFDVNAKALRNYSFTFPNVLDTNWKYYLQLSTSANGWMFANNYDVNQTGLNNDASVLENTKANAITYFGASNVKDLKANTWYNVKYVINRKNNKVQLFIDDVLFREAFIDFDRADCFDQLLIYNHSAVASADTSGSLLFDNFEVGTATDLLSFENGNGENITSSFVANGTVYVNATVYNNKETATDLVFTLAAYDAENRCIDIQTQSFDDVASGKYVELRNKELGYKNVPAAAKTIKLFVFEGWETLTPVCRDSKIIVAE